MVARLCLVPANVKSVGTGFKPRPGLAILNRGLLVSLNFSWQNPGKYFKVCHDHFLSHPVQFTIHNHLTIRWHTACMMRKQYNLVLPFPLVSDATEIFCTFVVPYNEINTTLRACKNTWRTYIVKDFLARHLRQRRFVHDVILADHKLPV
jgi:hypothetical protein